MTDEIYRHVAAPAVTDDYLKSEIQKIIDEYTGDYADPSVVKKMVSEILEMLDSKTVEYTTVSFELLPYRPGYALGYNWVRVHSSGTKDVLSNSDVANVLLRKHQDKIE